MKPTIEQLEIASEWLRCNESGNFEQEYCFSVAKYLDSLIEKMKENVLIKKHSKELGIPTNKIRKIIKNMK